MSTAQSATLSPDRDVQQSVPHHLLFNGEWRNSESETAARDINPATGELYTIVEPAGKPEALSAIEAAYTATDNWGNTNDRFLIGCSQTAALCSVAEVAAPPLGEP